VQERVLWRRRGVREGAIEEEGLARGLWRRRRHAREGLW